MDEWEKNESIQNNTTTNVKVGEKNKVKNTSGKEPTSQKLKRQVIKNKKVFIIVCSIICLAVIMGVIIAVVSNQHDYKVVDLSGMTVSEACKTATSHGWKVKEPISPNGSWESDAIREIDCDNSVAKISDYDYKENNHSVELKYNPKVDVKGMSAKDGIKLLRDSGWKENGVALLRCSTKASCGSSGTYLDIGSDSYDENEEIFTTYFDRNGVKVFLQTDKEEEPRPTTSNNSSTDTSNSSSSSQSNNDSSSSSQSDLCKSDYQKNLDAARIAYEAAQKAYDTYKSYGVDQATLDQYQSSLDLAKSSLDAAQKIYDTYCK